MYVTQEIADSVKNIAKKRKISIKDLLAKCELNINTISDFSRGQQISLISFARIADELDCSVDYLLGRTDNPTAHIKATPINSKLVHLLSQLTPEQQEFISAQIEGLLNAKK